MNNCAYGIEARRERTLTASGWETAKSMAIAAPRLGPTNTIGLFMCDLQNCMQIISRSNDGLVTRIKQTVNTFRTIICHQKKLPTDIRFVKVYTTANDSNQNLEDVSHQVPNQNSTGHISKGSKHAK